MLAALLALQLATASVADHPFAGHWVADMTASRFNGAVAVRGATLDFAVRPDAVEITERFVTTSGPSAPAGTTMTLVTDGQPHRHDKPLAGLMVVARWSNPRLLETTLTRPNGVGDRVTYELSADGHTLTVKTAGQFGTQEIVYRRQ